MYDVFEVSPETPKTENGEAENGKTENGERHTTNYLFKLNTNKLNNQSVSPIEKQKDGQTEISIDESYIKNQIGYSALVQCHNQPFVDELVLNILDMHFSKSVKIKGDIKPQCIIKSVLAKLTHWHVVYVIERYSEITTKIKNKKEYLQTMIYNSVLEMDAHALNEVRQCNES